MRDRSSSRPGTTLRSQGSNTRAKSLVCNILPLTRYDSWFYQDRVISNPGKALQTKVLADRYQIKFDIHILRIAPRLLSAKAPPALGRSPACSRQKQRGEAVDFAFHSRQVASLRGVN